ncbi:MAG: DUF938 domain-containing protein [Halioglobus sp.]
MSPQGRVLPFSQACENNKTAILEKLSDIFADRKTVLEFGSGTGQHATWFAQAMPWLNWQPTDIASNLPALFPRCAAYTGSNLLAAEPLDVTRRPWPVPVPSAVYTANSLHIMSFAAVQDLFKAMGEMAENDTVLVVYGPFNYGGTYTSDSNARFDQWLYQQHPLSAIRDFERVDELANNAGFAIEADHAMPANNRLLVWRKSA